MNKDSKLRTDTLKGIEALRNRLGGWMTVKELDTLIDATLIIMSAFENEQCQYCKHSFDPTDEESFTDGLPCASVTIQPERGE